MTAELVVPTREEWLANYGLMLHKRDWLKAIVSGLQYRSDVSPETRRECEEGLEKIEASLHVEATELGFVTVH